MQQRWSSDAFVQRLSRSARRDRQALYRSTRNGSYYRLSRCNMQFIIEFEFPCDASGDIRTNFTPISRREPKMQSWNGSDSGHEKDLKHAPLLLADSEDQLRSSYKYNSDLAISTVHAFAATPNFYRTARVVHSSCLQRRVNFQEEIGCYAALPTVPFCDIAQSEVSMAPERLILVIL